MDPSVSAELPATAEKTLKIPDSQQAFQTFANAMPSMVWVINAKGEMTFANAQWLNYTGLSEHETLGHGWLSALHPDDKLYCQQVILDAQTFKKPYKAEVRYRKNDGEYRWFLVQAQPLTDDNGNVNAWYGTSIDISDRKEIEELLHKSLEREQLIRRVVELTSHSFDLDHILKTVAEEVGRYFIADRCSVTRFSVSDGRLSLDMSAQFVREGIRPFDPADLSLIINAVRHLSPEAMVEGQEQIVNIADQAQYIEYLKARMESLPELPGLSTQQLIDIVIKYEIRSILRVNIFYRGIPYGGISLSYCNNTKEWQPEEVALLKAIAEQAGSAIYQAELYKKAQDTAAKELQARQEIEMYAQKLETSNRELEQFALIASHDLQEPLRKIKIFSELMSPNNAEENAQYLERIKNAAGRMQTLINNLLTLSRVQRKGNPLEPLDLNRTLQTVLDDLQIAIQEAGAEIHLKPLGIVIGDEGQIRQLLQNLIGNALKYRQEGKAPCIRIYGQLIEAGRYYQTTVEDNGIGIQPEYQQRIFEPFQRLHSTAQYPGTGIGLTICKKIIDRHHGQLSVESKPGEGSRFYFTLPSPSMP